MPFDPPRPCTFPGCRELVKGSPRCEAHKHEVRDQYDETTRRNDPALAMAARLRGSQQWRDIRATVIRCNPLCIDPFGHHSAMPAPATQVHHVDPLASAPHRAFDYANLVPLCTKCHARVEARERNGRATKDLFIGKSILSPIGLVSIE